MHNNCRLCTHRLPRNKFGIICNECYTKLRTIREDWAYGPNDAGQRSAGVTGGASAIVKVGDEPDIDYDGAHLPPYKQTSDGGTKKTDKMWLDYKNMNAASGTPLTNLMGQMY